MPHGTIAPIDTRLDSRAGSSTQIRRRIRATRPPSSTPTVAADDATGITETVEEGGDEVDAE